MGKRSWRPYAPTMRRYRIEYRPLDGWVVFGEPIATWVAYGPKEPPAEWVPVAVKITRDEAERYVNTVQARQLAIAS